MLISDEGVRDSVALFESNDDPSTRPGRSSSDLTSMTEKGQLSYLANRKKGVSHGVWPPQRARAAGRRGTAQARRKKIADAPVRISARRRFRACDPRAQSLLQKILAIILFS